MIVTFETYKCADRNPFNVSSCFDSLKLTRLFIETKFRDDHLSKAAKMQLYTVNCLVGFLVVVVTFPTASAHVSPFLLAELAEQAMINPEELEKIELKEPAMELTLDEPIEVELEKKKKIPHPPKKFVNVKWEDYEKVEYPLDVEIEEGQLFKLTCLVSAYPQATVNWVRGDNLNDEMNKLKEKSIAEYSGYQDPNRIGTVRATYVIDGATKNHEGLIHCVGTSRKGQGSQSLNIIVKKRNQSSHMRNPKVSYKFDPVITYNLDTIFSVIGSTVLLPCEAKGFPQPKTEWIDNKNVLVANNTHNDRFTVFENGNLVIKNLKWEDMGPYTCQAKLFSTVYDTKETFVYPTTTHENDTQGKDHA